MWIHVKWRLNHEQKSDRLCSILIFHNWRLRTNHQVLLLLHHYSSWILLNSESGVWLSAVLLLRLIIWGSGWKTADFVRLGPGSGLGLEFPGRVTLIPINLGSATAIADVSWSILECFLCWNQDISSKDHSWELSSTFTEMLIIVHCHKSIKRNGTSCYWITSSRGGRFGIAVCSSFDLLCLSGSLVTGWRCISTSSTFRQQRKVYLADYFTGYTGWSFNNSCQVYKAKSSLFLWRWTFILL